MDKKLLFLVSLFFLSFLSFSYIALKRSPVSTLIRASEEINPSPEKSVIFAWPLLVKLDQKVPVQITVFVKNNKDIPLANKKVTVLTNLGEIKENNLTTDKNGKAEFTLENSTPGEANIEALINDNIKLTKKVTIKFE